MAALTRQIAADRRVIAAYQKEYELGQRSLIDLLNAYNQLFNARVQLESTRGTAVFADYQLLAAMGQLLPYLKAPTTVDAEPLQLKPVGIFPIKLPPVLFKLPEPGSEPLNVSASGAQSRDGAGGGLRIYAAATPASPVAQPQEGSFQRRWPAAEFGSAWFEALSRGSSQAQPAATQPYRMGPKTSAFAPVNQFQPAWLSSAGIR
jgi:adhesin transport system outer membrane protein